MNEKDWSKSFAEYSRLSIKFRAEGKSKEESHKLALERLFGDNPPKDFFKNLEAYRFAVEIESKRDALFNQVFCRAYNAPAEDQSYERIQILKALIDSAGYFNFEDWRGILDVSPVGSKFEKIAQEHLIWIVNNTSDNPKEIWKGWGDINSRIGNLAKEQLAK